ncbi:MAG TPA: MBL fold metallo-hydrolase [Pyrinomonadaceae bacterium]|nr:MBL fold metallo-hydrolase [Pyrinomonadaceae bacterium]
MKTIAAIFLILAFPFFATQSAAAAEPKADVESPQGKVTLKWLGNAGWEIQIGATIILIDPFLTRKDHARDAEWKTDEEAVLKVIRGADFIFAGHSHHDHIGDVPFIAKHFRSKIIGSRTTANLALTAGVDKSQLTIISGGDKLAFKGFSVEVIESRHGWRRGRAPRQENEEISRPWQGPIRGRDFVDGGSFLYYFTFGQRRVLHQSTANFVEERLTEVRPDLALLAVGHDGYNLERVLKKLQPKAVVIQHFDEWRSRFSEGIPTASVRRAQRFAHDITAVDNQIKVVIPTFLMTYPLD